MEGLGLFPSYIIQIPDFYIALQGYSSLGWFARSGYKHNVITLPEVPVGGRARLASVSGRLRARLIQYGLHAGDCVRVIRVAPLGGPLLIEVNGREIALGRAVAENILVEAECASH